MCVKALGNFETKKKQVSFNCQQANHHNKKLTQIDIVTNAELVLKCRETSFFVTMR
jgi:hypothetical protein